MTILDIPDTSEGAVDLIMEDYLSLEEFEVSIFKQENLILPDGLFNCLIVKILE